MKNYTPQQQQILDHLRSGEHITQLQALGVYKIFRLSAIVFILRQDGWDIKREFHLDRTDRKYARYQFTKAQRKSKTPLIDTTRRDATRPTMKADVLDVVAAFACSRWGFPPGEVRYSCALYNQVERLMRNYA